MFEAKLFIFLAIILVSIENRQTQTSFTCVKDGLFAFNSCTQYYQCVFTNTVNAYKVLNNCPSGTLFDQKLQVCNWANQVKCESGSSTAKTTTGKITTTLKSTATTTKPVVTTTRPSSRSTKTQPITESIAGYYWLSWLSSTPPANINLGVCFSGWISVSDVLTNCAKIKDQLPGRKFLSFGGGNSNGRWTLSGLNNLDSGIRNKQLQGWDGIVYDVEDGDSGLAPAFARSFANAKANGFSVLVTVSHSQPYGISDAVSLMTSFFSDSNIDYLSPQLYTTGTETGNDYTAVGTSWNAYKSSKAKIVPSVVLGSRDYPTASNYFSQNYGIALSGFMQWAQGSGGSPTTPSGCQPNYYNQCTSNSQCCSNICFTNNGAWALGVCQPN